MEEENAQHTPLRLHDKTLRASKMNDTYALWKQMPRKKASSHKHH